MQYLIRYYAHAPPELLIGKNNHENDWNKLSVGTFIWLILSI